MVKDSSQIAATAFFILTILVQSQLFAVERPPTDGSMGKEALSMIPLSPVQGAAMSLLTINPDLKPLTQALTFSGTFYRKVFSEFFNCVLGQGCNPKSLLDLHKLWEESDVTPLLPAFNHAFKTNARWAATACGLITISAFSLMFSPGKGFMGIVGMASLYYCLMVEPETTKMLRSLLMMAILGGFAFWGEHTTLRQAKKEKQARLTAARQATAEPASPSGAPAKKKNRH